MSRLDSILELTRTDERDGRSRLSACKLELERADTLNPLKEQEKATKTAVSRIYLSRMKRKEER